MSLEEYFKENTSTKNKLLKCLLTEDNAHESC